MLYIIEAMELTCTRIKIGVSKSPKSMRMRIKNLRTGSPVPLRVAFLFLNANIEQERAMHKQFKECRVRGEYFSCELTTVLDYAMSLGLTSECVERYNRGKL